MVQVVDRVSGTVRSHLTVVVSAQFTI